MVEKKNIALCIVFTVLSCGLYGWYWLYCLAEDTNRLTGREGAMSGGLVLLLTIVTCGIYGWYWLYVSGEALEQYEVSRGGMGGGHLGILYLLLGIFGFGIISYALMQSELNKYAAEAERMEGRRGVTLRRPRIVNETGAFARREGR